MRTLFMLLFTTLILPRAEAQVIRLHAVVTKHSLVPADTAQNYVDSSYYFYSGDKGLSSINGNFISDSIHYFRNNIFSWNTTNIYDISDNLLTQTGGPMNGDSYWDNYDYDINGRVVKYYRSVVSISYQLSTDINYVYDASGNLTKQVLKSWSNSAGVMDSSWLVYTYAYDQNNSKTTELEQTWDSIPNTYKNIRRSFFTYNAQHNLAEKVEQYWEITANAWYYREKSTYAYEPNNDMVKKEYYGWHNSWEILSKSEYQYDTKHNVLEAKLYTLANNANELSQKITYTYTNFNQPKTELWANYFQGNTRFDYKQYYYGVHWPSGIEKSESKTAMKLYPNPATNVLTLELNENMPEGFTVAIYDMSGRLYGQWNEKATTNYKRTIPVDDLPAGNYIIKLNGGINEISRHFKVTH